MMKTIIMIAIAYFVVAFLVEVLINVFDFIFVSIGCFAEWLADKIKDMLGW